jgi:O-antigen ligase
MSAAESLSLPAAAISSQQDCAAPRWLLVATVLVVGLGFFFAGHDLRVSLAESYSQNAEQMELAASGGNLVRRLAMATVAAWGALLFVSGRKSIRLDPILVAPLVGLFGWIMISFVWADEPGMCLRRLFVLGCTTTAALGIARWLAPRDICWLALGTLGALALVGLLAEIALGAFRPWAADYRFAGTVHPNTQGPALATVCLAAIALLRSEQRGRVWLGCILIAAFGLLLLTKSRTTTAAILVAAGVTAMVQTRLKMQWIAGLSLSWLALAGLWLVEVGGYDPLTDFKDAALLGRAEEADTLSGRAFIWPEVLHFVVQRPWLGYGYESFWTPERIETISADLGWGLREAHNAYLETLLWLGGIGLALLLMLAAAGFLTSIRRLRHSGDSAYSLPLGLVVFGLINAGLESGMVAIDLVPFLLGCCLLRMGLFDVQSASAARRRAPVFALGVSSQAHLAGARR